MTAAAMIKASFYAGLALSAATEVVIIVTAAIRWLQ